MGDGTGFETRRTKVLGVQLPLSPPYYLERSKKMGTEKIETGDLIRNIHTDKEEVVLEIRMSCYSRYYVVTSGQEWERDDVEKVTEELPQPLFKKNDTVKIAKRVLKIPWAQGLMDRTIGRTAMVKHADEHSVLLDNGFWYPTEALELFVPKVKEERIVEFKGFRLGDVVRFRESRRKNLQTGLGVVTSFGSGFVRPSFLDKRGREDTGGMYPANLKHVDARFTYYRVPQDTYVLPRKPNLPATVELLRPYIPGSKYNFVPAGRGGAVEVVIKDGKEIFRGESICSLEDNFDYKEGRRLAVIHAE